MKLFSIPIIDCLLIIFVNSRIWDCILTLLGDFEEVSAWWYRDLVCVFLSRCCIGNGNPEGRLLELSGQKMVQLHPPSDSGDRE